MSEPLQTEEVVQQVSRCGECAIVHVETGTEVHVFHEVANEREPYWIRSTFPDIPENELLREALRLGFILTSIESSRGSVYQLERRCFGIRAAAIHALTLARMMPRVRVDAWMWLTGYEHDYRDDPPPTPPSNWPPTAQN